MITASLRSEKTHESLLLTLQTLEAKIGENSALLISYVRSKVNAEGAVSDTPTVEALKLLIESLSRTIEENE